MKNSAATNRTIDRLVGVTPEDTKISAARKGLDLMKLAGFEGTREYRQCERMLADAIARGVK